MDPIIGGALINAGSSLIGGLLGGGSNNHAGRDQRQATTFANRSAIIDKVAAAKEAGISPLYALGAPVISASSAVGSPGGGSSLGSTISEMGHDIGRAVAAKQTEAEREASLLQLDSLRLDNDLKRAQIAGMVSRQARESAPALPASEPMGKALPEPGDITAQSAQNEFGDALETVYGVGRWSKYADRELGRWSEKNLGFNVNTLTPENLGNMLYHWLYHDAGKRRTYIDTSIRGRYGYGR